jgi:hypothetical protein
LGRQGKWEYFRVIYGRYGKADRKTKREMLNEFCLTTGYHRKYERWREGNQPLRWTATGLLEAEKKFRRIKGYQEILLLKERLNPSRIQQKEVRTLEVA